MSLARLLFTVTLAPLAAGQVPFTHVLVDTAGPDPMHIKVAGDLDGDGFQDLVVAGTGGKLIWYEDRSVPGVWTRHVITGGGLGTWSTEGESGDLDGDGDQDLVLSDWYQNPRLVWFENLGGGAFVLHEIGPPRAHDIELADLDLDGDLDIATREKHANGGTIELWRNEGAGASWVHASLPLPAAPKGEGLGSGDMDLDGDPDLVIGRAWYENPGNFIDVGAWGEYVYAPGWGGIDTSAAPADMNGDGLPDIVVTPNEAQGGSGQTAWFEAPPDPRSVPWVEHVIEAGIETVTHSLALGDIDLDGDVDVLTAEMHQGADPDEVRVYLNDGAGLAWTKQVVATSGSHSMRLVDVGADGDLDLFGANWGGTTLVDLWENGLRSARLGTPFCYDPHACPCGNGAGPGEGCGNSIGHGGSLLGSGTLELVADDLVLTSSGLPPNTFGLVVMGDGQQSLVLGAGRLCVAGNLFRFPVRDTGAEGILVEGPGIAAHAQANFSPDGHLSAGATWHFQVWYRDPPGPCGATSNLSAALTLTFEA